MLLLPGLGDALAAGPILRGLTSERWTVDAMTMHPPVSDYVRELGIVRDVVQLPIRPTAGDTLRQVLPLRSRRYDRCIL
ncbi:MAG TPA: hypothetical protein VHR97_07300, partial [Candidatus Baltobacteraceae bacterium]|nr:hypothetical protein [Candidatus Baltobacteraceae bacterium]